MTFQSLSDFVFVSVDSTVNDTIKVGDLELKLDTRFHTTQHARVCGEVIAAPTHLTRKQPLYIEYEGSPKYLRHVTGEFVSNLIRNTPKHHRNNPIYTKGYRCGNYEPKLVHETEIKVRKGDVVYFHYNSLLNEENFWCKEETKLIYRIHYAELFCLVRDGEIQMLNGNVFVEEYRKEQHSFLYLPNNKPHPRIGKLAHIGHNIGPDTRQVKAGDLCLFRTPLFTEKEYTTLKDNHEISAYEVEGHRYYVKKMWDIVGVLKLHTDFAYEYDVEITPQGDFVMVRPDRDKPDNTVVYDPHKDQKADGKIFVLEATVKQRTRKGNFGTGIWLKSGENAPTMSGKIWYGKSSYYWFEEYDVAFVRSGDVLGWEEMLNN
jgi:hypothetical protein